MAEEPRPGLGPVLVHDGSACDCPPGSPLVHGPFDDQFLCASCLTPYCRGRSDHEFDWAAKAPGGIAIHASHLPMSLQQALVEGSAQALAMAAALLPGCYVTMGEANPNGRADLRPPRAADPPEPVEA